LQEYNITYNYQLIALVFAYLMKHLVWITAKVSVLPVLAIVRVVLVPYKIIAWAVSMEKCLYMVIIHAKIDV
jgi:hypothetical protein